MPGCADLIPEMKQSDFEAIIAGKHAIPTCNSNMQFHHALYIGFVQF